MIKNTGQSIRRLIINADDFGTTDDVTEAIIRTHINGIVTSASLLMTGAACERSIDFAQSNENLSVGIHLNLTEGCPLTWDKHSVSTLIGRNGLFLGSWGFRRKCFTFQVDSSQIAVELENQIRRFLDYGIFPSHIDSHHHVHTIPQVAWVVTELARKYHIRKIRKSCNLFIRDRSLKMLESCFGNLKLIYKKAINSYFDWHFITTNYFLSFNRYLGSEESYFERVAKVLANLPDGNSEIHFHPGSTGHENEECFLMDKRVVDLVKSLGIDLISYKEL